MTLFGRRQNAGVPFRDPSNESGTKDGGLPARKNSAAAAPPRGGGRRTARREQAAEEDKGGGRVFVPLALGQAATEALAPKPQPEAEEAALLGARLNWSKGNEKNAHVQSHTNEAPGMPGQGEPVTRKDKGELKRQAWKTAAHRRDKLLTSLLNSQVETELAPTCWLRAEPCGEGKKRFLGPQWFAGELDGNSGRGRRRGQALAHTAGMDHAGALRPTPAFSQEDRGGRISPGGHGHQGLAKARSIAA